jgi:hypothetical protein
MIAKKQGLTPEKIAELAVEKALREREEKYVKQQEEQTKAAWAEVNKKTEEAITLMQSKITSDPEKYEFCNQNPDAAKEAWKIVDAYWQKTWATGRPELLPYEEALDTVENALEEHFNEFLGKSKKLAAKKAAEEAKLAAAKKVEEASVAAESSKADRSKQPFKEFKPEKKISVPDNALDLQNDMFKNKNRRARIAEYQALLDKSKE